MNRIWERRAGEGDAAWQGFEIYLGGVRNERQCAEMIGKSESTIRRWAAKFEWRERARRYDNELLAETRAELRRRLADSFLKRWQDLDEMAALASEQLRAKIPAATARTLNEILTAATEKQLAILDKLDVLNADAGASKELTIQIVKAEGRPFATSKNSDAL